MKRTLLIITLILMFVISGSSAAIIAFAEIAPIHPEGKSFTFQNTVEHTLLFLYPDPISKAWYELKILEKRVNDLESVEGLPEEEQRINAVWTELDHVLKQFQVSEFDKDQNLRIRFDKILTKIHSELEKFSYLARLNPAELSHAQERINRLRSLVKDDTNSLSKLYELSQTPQGARKKVSSIHPFQPVLAPTIEPHKVPFLSGSVGADHEFFPLTGKHAELTCEGCHSDISYAGLPDQCVDCHLSVRPENHYEGVCTLCHTTDGWISAEFDHSIAAAVDCQSCHLINKPTNHFSGQCSACHSTNAWQPASFDHAVAGATDCQSCHSGNKPANHFSGQCSACHSTNAWRPASFDHAVAGATDCQSCHSGNKPANHFSGQCSACHSTSGWRPASFNHAAMGATDCQSCHSGNKPSNHYSGQCSACHSTDSWQGASFSHSFPMNHGKANGECAQCHPSGGSSWTCFNCHNEAKMNEKHQEKEIPDYVSRCLECHGNGEEDDD
jgi:hypothetical protein